MSYPEFMQRRSTCPEKAIVENSDTYLLPGMMRATAAIGDAEEQQNAAAPEQQQQDEQQQQQQQDDTKQNLRCVKDIWQAAIEGDVECLDANIKLGVALGELGQPIMSTADGTIGSQQGQQPIWGPLFDRCALFRATPLQYACAYNRIEAARFLLENGASWEQLSSTGVSAQDYARRRGYAEILALIEAAEAERKRKNQSA